MKTIELRLPKAKQVSDGLLAVVLVLIALSLLGQCSKYLWGHPMLMGFVPTFYVDYESNAPSWYSSAALGLAGVLLAVIAGAKFRERDRYRWCWATLSLLFVTLSADEISMLHELPIDPLREHFQWGGPLYYGWVVPGIAFVAVVGMVYAKFLWSLPTRTRNLLLFAAAVFVSGAIGVEMLSGVQADRFGEENLQYALIVTVEEMLEMLGVVILVRALWEYLEHHFAGVKLQFSTAR